MCKLMNDLHIFFGDCIMLPAEIIIKKTCFSNWEDYKTNEDVEEALSDYVSATYGFLYHSFCYKETEEEIIITDIIWDLNNEEDN